jgi:hypothetical protein
MQVKTIVRRCVIYKSRERGGPGPRREGGGLSRQKQTNHSHHLPMQCTVATSVAQHHALFNNWEWKARYNKFQCLHNLNSILFYFCTSISQHRIKQKSKVFMFLILATVGQIWLKYVTPAAASICYVLMNYVSLYSATKCHLLTGVRSTVFQCKCIIKRRWKFNYPMN